MPTDLPFGTLLWTIVRHTPPWVWLIFLLLTLLGLRQLSAHLVTRRRRVLRSIALTSFSLAGALSSFGLHPGVWLAWCIGLGAPVLVHPAPRAESTTRRVPVTGYHVAGSLVPLLLLWAVFAVRYAVGVSLAFHPGWRDESAFVLGASTLYGVLAGIHLARSRRIARSAPGLPALAARHAVQHLKPSTQSCTSQPNL
jgi:hypothetical protein